MQPNLNLYGNPAVEPQLDTDISRWVPIAEAFKALGLRPDRPNDLKAYEYFASPLIPIIGLRDGQEWRASSPYRVINETQVAILRPNSKLPDEGSMDSDTLTTVRASSEALQRVLKCPYLFDSVATTALKVGTRQIYFLEQIRPLDLTRREEDLPPAPEAGASREDRIAFREARNRVFAQLDLDLDAWLVDELHDLQRLLMLLRGHCMFFNQPWEYRKATKKTASLVVAPLFVIPEFMPEADRDPWWFDAVFNRLLAREQDAASGKLVVPEFQAAPLEEMRRFAPNGNASVRHRVSHLCFERRARVDIFLRRKLRSVLFNVQGKCNHPGCNRTITKPSDRRPGQTCKFCPDHRANQSSDEKQRERDGRRRRAGQVTRDK